MDWQLFTRDQHGEATGGIPAITADVVTRRIATGRFVVEAPYTEEAWFERLTPGCGQIIRRGGHTILSGPWTRRTWGRPSAEYPLGIIAMEGVTDDVIGQYRLCAPDPTRPLDQQSTVATWTRTGPIETLMHALVNENCGPAALVPSTTWPTAPTRRIPGLVMGADQGRGPVVAWSTLRYPTVQDELRRMAAFAEAAGVRLLPKFHQTSLGLTFEVLQADDLTDQVVFGPGLGNLDEQEYVEEAGSAWLAVAAGKGEGVMRMQRVAVTEDEFTLAFGVGRELYGDRRDTAEWAELDKAALEAVEGGVASVSFRCTALETEGTRYGDDFDLNTLATVQIGPSGTNPDTGLPYRKIATFNDLVRELHFSLDPVAGIDRVKAAVGSEGASTGVELPSLKKLAALNAELTQLQRSL